MEETALATLPHWANFYVITGSAAAALTGLQFVVIVLNAQMNLRSEAGISAFATPTIVHFATVLLTAGLLTAPWPSATPIAFLLGLCGTAGLVYAALIFRTARQQTAYTPVMEDWLCHFILPPLAYGTLLVAALLLLRSAPTALFAVAGAVLVLLFVGIHNAWDGITFSVINQRQPPQQPGQSAARFSSRIPPSELRHRRRLTLSEHTVNIGDTAPDFSATTDTGARVALSDYRGKRVVLYFYPKDDTPGCTTQSCGFRDAYPQIEEKNAVVLGVSPDGQKSHAKFRSKFNLPFTLLVDEDHAIAEAYGVWGEKSMYGRKYMGIERSHFVIDERGVIVDAQVKVSPQDSVARAIAALG